MQMEASQYIDASPAQVWAALQDARILRDAVPGCESLTGNAIDGFDAVVVQKVGPVRARFTGSVVLSDRQEGTSMVLRGTGKGGIAGFASGEAHIRFHKAGTGTKLHYQVTARVGGKLAQLGARIIDGFARKMAEAFFARFCAAIEPGIVSESGPGASVHNAA
ncbi:MAG: CoxG family protein [Pararhodobacter sp.]